MKSKIAEYSLLAAVALALVAGLAFAQQEGGTGAMHHGMRGMRGGFMGQPGFAMMLHQLNLTPDQKAQVKQIFEAEKFREIPWNLLGSVTDCPLALSTTSGIEARFDSV